MSPEKIDISAIPAFSDNYIWLLQAAAGACAVVDPGEHGPVLEVLRAAEGWLRARGVDGPRLSSELLLARVLDVSRMELYLAYDRPLSDDECDRLRPLVAERGTGSPVAYVLGDVSFRGHRLSVTRDVLVPRPETEELVDVVAQGLRLMLHVQLLCL